MRAGALATRVAISPPFHVEPRGDIVRETTHLSPAAPLMASTSAVSSVHARGVDMNEKNTRTLIYVAQTPDDSLVAHLAGVG